MRYTRSISSVQSITRDSDEQWRRFIYKRDRLGRGKKKDTEFQRQTSPFKEIALLLFVVVPDAREVSFSPRHAAISDYITVTGRASRLSRDSFCRSKTCLHLKSKRNYNTRQTHMLLGQHLLF